MATTQSEDRIGSPNGPEHSRTFETGSDHGFTSGFDDARAHKEVLATKLGIFHPLRVALKVVGLAAYLLDDFRMAGRDGALSLRKRRNSSTSRCALRKAAGLLNVSATV